MTCADDLINILRSAAEEQKKLLALELTKLLSCYGPRITYSDEKMIVYRDDGTVAFIEPIDIRSKR